MSHTPKTMKGLQRSSQRPMVKSENVIKPATIDSRHAAELERRSAVQRIPGPKPSVDK